MQPGLDLAVEATHLLRLRAQPLAAVVEQGDVGLDLAQGQLPAIQPGRERGHAAQQLAQLLSHDAQTVLDHAAQIGRVQLLIERHQAAQDAELSPRAVQFQHGVIVRAAGVDFAGPRRLQVAQRLVELRPQLHVLRLRGCQLGQHLIAAGRLANGRDEGGQCRIDVHNLAAHDRRHARRRWRLRGDDDWGRRAP